MKYAIWGVEKERKLIDNKKNPEMEVNYVYLSKRGFLVSGSQHPTITDCFREVLQQLQSRNLRDWCEYYIVDTKNKVIFLQA